ncbi:MAG TPA: hypothetical protein VFH39_03625 [Candidatus Saccharimonadales bacterium]|nr:hypothetical protein [Candidatus Saccharimonadales bacterium]
MSHNEGMPPEESPSTEPSQEPGTQQGEAVNEEFIHLESEQAADALRQFVETAEEEELQPFRELVRDALLRLYEVSVQPSAETTERAQAEWVEALLAHRRLIDPNLRGDEPVDPEELNQASERLRRARQNLDALERPEG